MTQKSTPSEGKQPPGLHFLLKYGHMGASSRLRARQFFGPLQAAGYSISSSVLLDDNYLHRLYSGRTRPFLSIASSILRRAREIARLDSSTAAVYVQYECLPYLPFFAESALYKRLPVAVDFDDAIHVLYHRYSFLRNKISNVMAAASHVVVGSQALLDVASRHNANVTLIPTVIDETRYSPRLDYAFAEPLPVVGWVGTPRTVHYLDSILASLRELNARLPFVLRLVGAPLGYRAQGLNVDVVPWSEHTESRLIAAFDVGIMPLTDDPFSRGKCGYKLIQYMGCAVPGVGSLVGANAAIITHGHDGLLASSPEEFGRAVESLLMDRELRARLGRAARTKAERQYSIGSALPSWLAIFDRLTNSTLGERVARL